MQLSKQKQSELKAKAHKLNPVILIGSKGLTESVRLETDRALEAHELIKVRIHTEEREICQAIAAELSTQCSASLIAIVGRIAILYRKRLEEAKTQIPQVRKKPGKNLNVSRSKMRKPKRQSS